MHMMSYLLAMVVVSVGYFSYGYMMNNKNIESDWFPQLEESDFTNLNPFRDWK
tara:strand:+ start:131 stop:289 length:159 start_codon:yes stop_codon:yes gene_type:complete